MTAQSKGRPATTLLPRYEARRKRPVNLKPSDLPLFQRELTRSLPPAQLLELRNVRISPDGLFMKRGRILKESFAFSFLREDWKKRAVVKAMAQNYLMRPTRSIDDEVVWITDLWSAGYFHWIADSLCKLEVVTELLRDRVLLLPHDVGRLDFVRQSLGAFPVRNIQFIGANEVLKCARVLRPTPIAPSGHFREEVICAVRQRLLNHFVPGAPDADANRRIYISRRHAPKRKITNEAEVIEVLRDYEIEVLEMENLSFGEQVQLMSEARFLVSNHGAGLTNMLFLPSASSVLELRHKTDATNNCYFTLSSALGLRYFYQMCDPVSDEDANRAHLHVDPIELRKNLELILRSSA